MTTFHKSNKGNYNDARKALQKRLAKVSIADHNSVENTAQAGHICKASVFDVLKPSKPGSRPPTLVTTPEVSTSRKEELSPRVYDPKAPYRIVFKERGQSFQILNDSMIQSDSGCESF